MAGNDTPRSQRDQLTMALAIDRGIEFMQNYKFDGTAHTALLRGGVLYSLYTDIHRALFTDSHGHPADPNRAGSAAMGEKREQLRECMHQMAGELFNDNGHWKPGIESGTLSDILARYYQKLKSIELFPYGNDLTLRLFFASLPKISGFDIQFPGRTIDFRRIKTEDADALRTADNHDALKKAFAHSLTGDMTPRPPATAPWPHWSDRTVQIGGMRFLGYKQNQKEYLVTVNGGLVERQNIEQKLLEHIRDPQKRLDTFRLKPEDIHHYLSEELRNERRIDGIDISGGAPLLCMDVNLLTGLSKANHDEMVAYLKQANGSGERDPLFGLNDKAHASEILRKAPEEMKPMLEQAARQIQGIVTHVLDPAMDAVFKGKTPVDNPQMFMTMGGGGSGKDDISEAIVENACGKNYVRASLDSSREISAIYKVLNLAGHHADDYAAVEDIAKTLRHWIKERALENGYNILYDGTGVPYEKGYQQITREFKTGISSTTGKQNKPFTTSLIAVDAMLHVLPERTIEFPAPVASRIISRYQSNKPRGLAWNVALGKHVALPLSVIRSAEDKHMDNITVVDNAGPQGSAYTLAQLFTVENTVNQNLISAQDSGNLLETLKKHALLTDGMLKTPGLDEDNVAVLTKQAGDRNRVLVVTNAVRMTDLAQKGQLNPDAVGQNTLPFMHPHLAFHVPALDTPITGGRQPARGMLNLQVPSSRYQEMVTTRVPSANDRDGR